MGGFGKPGAVIGQFNQFGCGEIINAPGRRIAQRLEQPGIDQRWNVMRLTIEHPGRLLCRQTRRQPAQNLSRVRAGGRATEFASRGRRLGITGVTLHSYRYAWAERAKTAGMPERFAMENLGHNSKAVHRAYAKRALMKIPSLEDYERLKASAI